MKTRRLTYSSTKISTNKALGFSLIEMLVVILILSLLSGVVITSLNSVDNRRLSNQAEKLKIWLQGVQQYATLHGLEYGIAQQKSALVVVTPFSGRWYRVAKLDTWQIPDELILQLPDIFADKQIANTFVNTNGLDLKEFNPVMVFSPNGFIAPQGRITLQVAKERISMNWLDNQSITWDQL